MGWLFGHLVGAGKQRWRDCDPNSLRRLFIATDLETALIFYRVSGNVAVLLQSEQQQHPARE
jgi:hypothetical protein